MSIWVSILNLGSMKYEIYSMDGSSFIRPCTNNTGLVFLDTWFGANEKCENNILSNQRHYFFHCVGGQYSVAIRLNWKVVGNTSDLFFMVHRDLFKVIFKGSRYFKQHCQRCTSRSSTGRGVPVVAVLAEVYQSYQQWQRCTSRSSTDRGVPIVAALT